MYEGSTVGVVVPAYNESGHVSDVIETIPAFVDRVYVVDDGSTDGTWEAITATAALVNEQLRNRAVADGGTFDRRIVPIRHDENRGVGGAIKTGYQHAIDDSVDVTAVIAGDGQMDPEDLDRLLDPVVDGRADYAKGNRLLSRSNHAEMPTVRFVGNVALTFLTKLASGYWGVGDPQNGYTAISRSALEAIPVEDMYEDYGYCNDLLVKLNVEGIRVVDVSIPVTYGAEESGIRYERYVPRVSFMLLRSFLRRLTKEYVVDDFHPLVLLYALGTFGIGTRAVGWLRGIKAGGDRPADSRSSAGTFLAALALVLAMIHDRAANEHLDRDPIYPDED